MKGKIKEQTDTPPFLEAFIQLIMWLGLLQLILLSIHFGVNRISYLFTLDYISNINLAKQLMIIIAHIMMLCAGVYYIESPIVALDPFKFIKSKNFKDITDIEKAILCMYGLVILFFIGQLFVFWYVFRMVIG